MKAGFLLLLFAFVCLVAEAQTALPQRDSPGLSVLKFSWSKERINWERDPFSAPNENMDELRVRMRNERRMQEAKRSGSQIDMNRVERESRADEAIFAAMRQKKPPRYGFLYKATLTNEGDVGAVAVDWDYIFLDAATGRELGRRQFTSEEKIGPGKKKELSFFVSSPPTQTISAHALDRRERNGLGERVEIVRVLYEDGTVWEAQ